MAKHFSTIEKNAAGSTVVELYTNDERYGKLHNMTVTFKTWEEGCELAHNWAAITD